MFKNGQEIVTSRNGNTMLALDMTYGKGWMQKRFPYIEFHNVDVNQSNNPHLVIDWTKKSLPFPDESFDLIIFDPPFIPWRFQRLTGNLEECFSYWKNTEDMTIGIIKAFLEIKRLLCHNGYCVAKWGNTAKSFDWFERFFSPLELIAVEIANGKGTSFRDKTRDPRKTFLAVLRKT